MDNAMLLDDMCQHCNNYFNPHNDPTAPRDYPANFLALVGKIAAFIENVGDKDNVTDSRVGSGSESVNLEYSSWEKSFARELSKWKRARFI